MITITPQGSVCLCKTPLEKDYKHQLTFASATAQNNYFNGSSVKFKTYNDYTYIKKDNQIVVGDPIDTIINCNYLFYTNTGFTTKTYYCFITNMEYVNENATRITFETDVYQTYMFNITTKNCFVEREHVNDDTIGKNTTHEGLDTGEFVINGVDTFDEYANDYYIVAGVSKLPAEIAELNIGASTLPSRIYNCVYSGLTYIVLYSYEDATKLSLIMDGQGIAENIYDMFMIPKSIVTITNNDWVTTSCAGTITIPGLESWSLSVSYSIKYKILPNSTTEQTMKASQTITRNTTLNGYTPKNNKMFTGEFNYMYVTNNAGSDAKYNYEDFYANTPIFSLIGAVTPGCSIRLIPKNYKLLNQSNSQDYICNPYGLSGAKYPVCSWASDSYTNWLTQQSVNITTEQVTSAVTTAGLGVMGTPAAALGLLGIITDEMSLKQRRDYSPVQAKGNLNAGDVTWAMGWNQFVLFKMSCRYEFAKRIDDYFSMFGYKVNEIKTPNITGRRYWNYVKTVGCDFEGDIPQEYLNKIREIFNNGCTFWHDASHFLDYTQSNTIVS